MASENFQKIMLLHPRNRYGTYSEHCRTLPTASNIKKRDSIIVIHRSWNQYKAQEQCVRTIFPKKEVILVCKRIKIQNRYFKEKIYHFIFAPNWWYFFFKYKYDFVLKVQNFGNFLWGKNALQIDLTQIIEFEFWIRMGWNGTLHYEMVGWIATIRLIGNRVPKYFFKSTC